MPLQRQSPGGRGGLRRLDREPRDFFRRAFKKREAAPQEFDLTVNRDYLKGPGDGADLIATAYRRKFGGP